VHPIHKGWAKSSCALDSSDLPIILAWLYAHDKRDPAVLVKPVAMIISSGLWFGSFAMLISARYTSDAAQISKFIMWGVATAIEIAGHAFAPPPGHLRSMGSLSARLATLVTIILGEGEYLCSTRYPVIVDCS
jgi:low temperature requirement protein LtrA